ncbi:hypothetical protein, partial [Pseudomonas sp. FW215-R2]|uniref:hypothetical protein n=1 Tax=Pseudomonas sp. FW215-R2 TaxID=2070615 RepID=UPI001C47BD29
RGRARPSLPLMGAVDFQQMTEVAVFVIKGTDTSGHIELKRETPASTLKKARELTGDGCWDVSITTPDGHVYQAPEFERLETASSSA